MKLLFPFVLYAIMLTNVNGAEKTASFESALRHGAIAKYTLHIVDDQQAVADANVKVFMGMNFRPKGHWIEGLTDANGMFLLEGKTTGDEIELFISKSGYYHSYMKFCLITMGKEHRVVDGKWQPYATKKQIELRLIRHPITLKDENFLLKAMQTNTWIGVDVLKKDWVKPVGNGEYTDFEVKVECDCLVPAKSRFCRGEMRFIAPYTGGYYEPKVVESSYPYPYCANTNEVYETSLKVIDREGDPHRTKNPFRHDAAFVFRTRCITNSVGNLVSGNYGYIRNFRVKPSWAGVPTVFLSYVYNPTPNDTNLEPKR